jgi:hypothetical protein
MAKNFPGPTFWCTCIKDLASAASFITCRSIRAADAQVLLVYSSLKAQMTNIPLAVAERTDRNQATRQLTTLATSDKEISLSSDHRNAAPVITLIDIASTNPTFKAPDVSKPHFKFSTSQ